MRRLITVALVAGLAIFAVACSTDTSGGYTVDSESADRVAELSTSNDTSSELRGYDGLTVEQTIAGMQAAGVDDILVALVDAVGYDLALQSWLEAEPQIGSDAFEKAVFDGIV